MKKIGCILAAVLFALVAAGALLATTMFGAASVQEETAFIISPGSSLTSVARELEEEGLITSADGFLMHARVFGSGDPIQAGEFQLTPGMDQSAILRAFQTGQVIRRFVTIPEGMPSIMVFERLMAEDLLTGEIDVPPEGSVLPETYDFERGEARAAVLARMKRAMGSYLDEAWEQRSADAAVKSKKEAVILASIIEKETQDKQELAKVSGVLSNRIRIGMMLGADATTIYPITKGKPLGRMIRVSELRDPNPYNTRAISGLPIGPITNPSRAAIKAALDPDETTALYYVADGSGGHVFADTLEEHNRNVAEWRRFRAENGI
ncbi:endolytic transglycosylase MltG [Altererythrobacter lutimaris]|uniref:Endolytic murein transglycosylase n=1 Tax=Altererythrobacter lutimaris TaxID=2743979 RepID=A0A850H9D9_9SPHN|nr:endolytic transglycosylase MltG [Altererythrobacter lutimaris]NVE94379.1 endolytic transglycosylase MltG [Altererythrobacter lutimaris]